jgi:hypothetical protein
LKAALWSLGAQCLAGITHGHSSGRMKAGGVTSVLLQGMFLSAPIYQVVEFRAHVNVSVSQRWCSMLEAKEQASYTVDKISSTTKNSIQKAQSKIRVRTPGTPCTNLRRRQQYGQTNRPIYFEQIAVPRVLEQM